MSKICCASKGRIDLNALFMKVCLFSLILSVALNFSGEMAYAADNVFDTTDTVVSENPAGLIFLMTPDDEAFSDALAVAYEHKLIWANRIAKPEGSNAKFFSGGVNQLSNDSGFTFNLNTTGAPVGFNAMIGINKMFYFTKDNLGEEEFARMVSGLDGLPQTEGGWVSPGVSWLYDLGLSVIARYPDGNERDITSLITFFTNVSELEDGKIMLSYGAVIVDRAITNNEGQELFLSEDDERVLSDGLHDETITGTWWIAKVKHQDNDNSSSGGCSAGAAVPSIVVIALAVFAFTKKRKIF
jgi:hypothetical protein